MTTKETRDMDVRIVSIEFDTTIEGQKGSYQGTEVVYKTASGETNTKGMHENTFKYNKQLRTDLEQLQRGDYARVTTEKAGSFVNWLSAKKIDAPTRAATTVGEPSQARQGGSTEVPTKQQVKSNYETPEERAQRQVYIVRQSSLTAALKFFEVGLGAGSAGIPETEDVIEIAKEFEAYVLS